MPPKKGKGRAKRSHRDADVAAEGQVNVHADIHPAPPEEDMPQRPCNPQQRPCHPRESGQSAIGCATSRGDLRLVVQPVMAICDWSCNQSWRSAIGHTISRSDLRLVMRLPMTSLAITLWNRTTSCTTSRTSNCSV